MTSHSHSADSAHTPQQTLTDEFPTWGRPSTSSPLAGTVALVTGASSGIGEGTALALAALGARVSVVARRADRLDALVEKIAGAGGHALAVGADLTDEEQAHAVVARTVETYGRLDTVVANAGVMILGPITGADTTDWRRMIELNTLGLMYTAHAASPHLLEAAANGPRNVADLVLVSSTAGRMVRGGGGVYNASKYAVNAFGEAFRKEVTQRHLRVSLVEPGAVETELPLQNRPEVQERMYERYSTMECLRPEDVADTIGFIVTRPRHVAVNEVLVRPTEQQE
ncbi:NADP-dependent 3-hydroxy acid dehydrogenase YdfG [Streptomyces sp. SAI-117]|uniref:SDR family NAD(P)-dependent oxidoreductase n=1 Tax=Streptomyces sp. SAI-117 TaxID=2940546 RepID=UPI002475C382|nr:SDR family NAD(P)-dependent oxidoreductase [Streptomyces sp. SAI-117]MDH6573653.1 NADP-dependent 3-hydroxy acid dehydrogenase YdfG [Streptomyces sp. SAI-117]